MCQWPIGNPGEPGFRFCDQTAMAGRPYCHEHCSLAYRRKSESVA
ncbi:MAG: GcrA family cell cycle regulator [Alphaproteobacteria bacterium]|nr:GcrA family cell cycle regulator [Alphaproteobacteria bacterium]